MQMTSREEIERLLQMTGRTLEELPESYPSYRCRDAVLCAGITTRMAGNMICHQSDVIELLVGALKDALDKQPKWVNVDERLPEKSGYYLYLGDGPNRGLQNGVGVSYYQHKAKIWKKAYNPCVTKWMPLPEPPKEKNQ